MDEFDTHRLEPVAETTVKTRITPLAWPAELNSEEPGHVRDLSGAFLEAQEAFRSFDEVRRANAANPNLTPEGKLAADREWARRELPVLEARFAKLRESVAAADKSFSARVQKEFMGAYAEAPTEPADIALAQEIRTWLRGLPQAERETKARQLATAGDKVALRAILTAPDYLTGLDTELLKLVREDLVRKALPGRYLRMEALRSGGRASLRALDGVIRHVGHATGTLGELRPVLPMERAA